jgi:peptidoglycan/LPS O-acetylase OafA/YrhL
MRFIEARQRPRPSARAPDAPQLRDNRSINALRAFAALAVVVHHVRPMLYQDYSGVPHNVLVRALYGQGLGHTAVIVFFVLSGYWVGGGVLRSVGRGRFNWRDYAVKRLVRLWIVLLPALVLTASLDVIGREWFASSTVYTDPWFYPPQFLQLGTPFSLEAALGNIVFLQSIHVPPFGTNGPLWSLACEFWYYAIFPCAVIAVRGGSSPRARVACAAGFLIGCAISGTEVLKLFLVWLLGVLVAHHQSSIQGTMRRLAPSSLAALRLVASAGFIAAVLCWSASPGAIHWRVGEAAVGLATACLLAVLLDDVHWHGIHGWLLRSVSGYARASYSLYAIHLPILALVTAAFIARPERRWHPDHVHLAVGALVVLAILLIAWVFATFTEMHTDRVRIALLRQSRLR